MIIADLIQLVYVSQPFGYDTATLSGILLDARRCNERDGITGALVCRHDIFLQFLEGPEATVTATYDRIRRDDRHVEPRQLLKRPSTTRIFGDWAMLHDPAKSVIWSLDEIAQGALERATEDEILEMFEGLAETVRDTPAN
jgi:hypothetical protein